MRMSLAGSNKMLVEYQRGPFAHYLPYTPDTQPTLQRLAALRPRTLATMTGLHSLAMGAGLTTSRWSSKRSSGDASVRRSPTSCSPNHGVRLTAYSLR